MQFPVHVRNWQPVVKRSATESNVISFTFLHENPIINKEKQQDELLIRASVPPISTGLLNLSQLQGDAFPIRAFYVGDFFVGESAGKTSCGATETVSARHWTSRQSSEIESDVEPDERAKE